MDCLFCKIANGEIPSEIIYEDDLITCFLDIEPETNGHTLIVPKKHILNYHDLNDDTLLHIQKIVKKLYPMYQEKLHCDGLTLSNNAYSAQNVKHYHLHFIPRYKNDGVKYLSNQDILKDIKEIKSILKKL